MTQATHIKAAGDQPSRLCHLNLGFLRDRRLARILDLAGHPLHFGRPLRPEDAVLAWGHSPIAARAEALAARHARLVWRAEDAFLRSVRPGRAGGLRLGLMLDPTGGVHYDPARPSALETLLATHPLDHSDLLLRARDGLARIRQADLSKYNLHRADLALPAPGYVLVVDQTRGDASLMGAGHARFREMLVRAQEDHPQAQILIKSHPETLLGLRPGHFSVEDTTARVSLCAEPLSPWVLLEGAVAVYTVSSQLGFEAILAGHRPQVYGQPFYAGWGLTDDDRPVARRQRVLTRTQLFAAAMILAPLWYDPCRDRLGSFEDALAQLEAETRAHREDREGYVAARIRLWKRPHMQAIFGRERPVIFARDLDQATRRAQATGRKTMHWGDPTAVPEPGTVTFVEDGFLRSRGLGAELVPPVSLIADDLGLYYDPSGPSAIERAMMRPLGDHDQRRAERVIETLQARRLSKYNIGGQEAGSVPPGHCILVPGQVEDDASIRLGALDPCRNMDLLARVRRDNPGAVILYKPHPDVEAGLRPGKLDHPTLQGLADVVLTDVDAITAIDLADEVWTMTSLLGFEALLRGKPVTCLGVPFYAGWGLTRDLAPVPERRLRMPDGSARPKSGLTHLVHAALIAAPRYHDPVSGLPCPVEVALDRLSHGPIPEPGAGNRLLAKLQGVLAGQARLWRR